jgi:uncharacterized membrane protein YgaE (UPF0421/DUF939 family)
MDWSTVISTVVGVIAGGFINAYFSRQGSKELRREANELKQETDNLQRLTIMLMRLLDQANVLPVKWDENGNPLMTVESELKLRWYTESNDEDTPTDEEGSRE